MFKAPGIGAYLGDALDRLDYIQAEGASLLAHDGAEITFEAPYSSTLATIARRYVYGASADEPLVWYEGSGTTNKRWLVADERGSVIAATDGNGNALSINAYDAYGNESVSNVTYRGRFGYTGQAWLPSVGMNSYKARMYSPNLGRFLQTDPIGYPDGINWYNYVRSDPVNATDPSGLRLALDPDSRVLPIDPKTGNFTGPEVVVTAGCGNFCTSIVGSQGIANLLIQLTPLQAPQLALPDEKFTIVAAKPSQGKAKSKRQSKPLNLNACAVAMKEMGKVQTTGLSGAFVDLVGATGGAGTFVNLRTGTSGYYVTGGPATGVDASVGIQGGLYSSMSAFLGFSVGASGTIGNMSGSISANNSGVGSAFAPALGGGAAASLTYTTIFGCSVGGK